MIAKKLEVVAEKLLLEGAEPKFLIWVFIKSSVILG